jgi:hypothetical protein
VCLAFGCDASIRRDGPSGSKINGLTCLCWNHPCGGTHLLRLAEEGITARIGYGWQSHPSEFLAVLAQSRVPADYPVRVGEDVRTVVDLVESEKQTCRPGGETSSKLIGLSYYVDDDATWQNRIGETWSVERLVREELGRSTDGLHCGGTYRLMALSYVVDRRMKRGLPIAGPYFRAKRYVGAFHDYAFQLQNSDGSWHPMFFAARGGGGAAEERLRSTGHIAEWLVFSLPERQLQDPQVVRTIAYLCGHLAQQSRINVAAMSPRHIATLMHAVRALALYDQRVYKPRDVQAPADDEKKLAEKPETKA